MLRFSEIALVCLLVFLNPAIPIAACPSLMGENSDIQFQEIASTNLASDQQWSSIFHLNGTAFAYSVVEGHSGGYTLAGQISHTGAGFEDVWLSKADDQGKLVWDQFYPSNERQCGRAVIECQTGGYAIACVISAEYSDTLIIRTDVYGNLLWQSRFDFGEEEDVYAISELSTGELVISGFVHHYRPTNPIDGLLFCINSSGSLHWQQEFGGLDIDRFYAMERLNDDSLILAGLTHSYRDPDGDMWLLKTTKEGIVEWNQSYGSPNFDRCNALATEKDGSFTMTGITENLTTSRLDILTIHTSSTGNLIWNRTIGSELDDTVRAIVACDDGGYAITGDTSQSPHEPWSDMFLFRLGDDGQLLWQKIYGGLGNDIGWALVECSEGDFVIAGSTTSFGLESGSVWLNRIPDAALPSVEPSNVNLYLTGFAVGFALVIIVAAVSLLILSHRELKNRIRDCV